MYKIKLKPGDYLFIDPGYVADNIKCLRTFYPGVGVHYAHYEGSKDYLIHSDSGKISIFQNCTSSTLELDHTSGIAGYLVLPFEKDPRTVILRNKRS